MTHGEVPSYPAPVSEDGYAVSHTRQSSLDFGLDFDFESEVGIASEEIVPELSLGLIGKQTRAVMIVCCF